MSKFNCWEFKKCGREVGGARTKELGVCPASTEFKIEGVNGGKAAGRACWAIAGTLCGGKMQGTFATKYANCLACEFYLVVYREEGAGYKNTPLILEKLNPK